MNRTLFFVLASAFLVASPSLSHANCAPQLNERLAGAERVVDSLRSDKPGQMRVFASDGSEYTAAEALWMKGQLRSVLRACSQGDETAATSTLSGVTELLKAHHATRS
jgi:hypothetical protein